VSFEKKKDIYIDSLTLCRLISKPSFIVCTIEHGISSGITSQSILIDSVFGLAVGVEVKSNLSKAI
jgi:hypothetical protein